MEITKQFGFYEPLGTLARRTLKRLAAQKAPAVAPQRARGGPRGHGPWEDGGPVRGTYAPLKGGAAE